MDNDLINLVVPSKSDYISVIRITTSSIANNMGFNIEEIEDIKVSIAEACINALGKSKEICIKYKICLDKLVIDIKDVNENVQDSSKDDCYRKKELGILIIKSLMDKVEFNKKGIRMIKKIEDGNK